MFLSIIWSSHQHDWENVYNTVTFSLLYLHFPSIKHSFPLIYCRFLSLSFFISFSCSINNSLLFFLLWLLLALAAGEMVVSLRGNKRSGAVQGREQLPVLHDSHYREERGFSERTFKGIQGISGNGSRYLGPNCVSSNRKTNHSDRFCEPDQAIL